MAGKIFHKSYFIQIKGNMAGAEQSADDSIDSVVEALKNRFPHVRIEKTNLELTKKGMAIASFPIWPRRSVKKKLNKKQVKLEGGENEK